MDTDQGYRFSCSRRIKVTVFQLETSKSIDFSETVIYIISGWYNILHSG